MKETLKPYAYKQREPGVRKDWVTAYLLHNESASYVSSLVKSSETKPKRKQV